MNELDLTKIESIPHHKTLAIMNQYLIQCTAHINKLSDYGEKEMIETDFSIDQLEAKVTILEKKLGIVYEKGEP